VKGFDEPVAVWRALGERVIETRFAAARSDGAGPILGRERELAFLADSWQRALRGNGHVVLVSGEAGMGKSRLVEAFAEHLHGREKRLLRCQCSPYHRNTALHPVTQLLKHELMLRPDAPAPENLSRIEQMLARIGRSSRVAKVAARRAARSSVADSLSAMEMTLAQRKERDARAARGVPGRRADADAVLLIIEDAHWSDPTTQTLIERLLKRISAERALMVVTFRRSSHTSWSKHPHATLISCKPLERTECASLVRRTAARARIDPALIEQLVARSDGVPLFAEELTKAVMELEPGLAGSVPLTLQDSLAARLDRLGNAREIAQVASVIGRQFSYALLAAISGASRTDLVGGLERLKAAGTRPRCKRRSRIALHLQSFAGAGGRLREPGARSPPEAACGDCRSALGGGRRGRPRTDRLSLEPRGQSGSGVQAMDGRRAKIRASARRTPNRWPT
jgi:predicted ATPase